MKDTDKIQVWQFTTKVAPGEYWDAINTKTVETLDFERGVREWHYSGVHEGTRVNERGTDELDLSIVTPERAAQWRRRNGYTRIR